MPRPQLSQGGFTLPELVTVLAITAVLALVSLPALNGAMDRHRLEDTGDALFTSLSQARATAIRRGHTVRACPSEDGRTCSAAADWSRGWIVRDQAARALINLSDAIPRGIHIVRSARRAEVDFHPDGSADGDNQRISLCLRGKPHTAVSIVVARAGRIRRETPPADIAAACARHRGKMPGAA